MKQSNVTSGARTHARRVLTVDLVPTRANARAANLVRVGFRLEGDIYPYCLLILKMGNF